ncbi:MAG: hypothetical protein ACI9HK_000392 [Pirellulaceae bacterium]|jgi:hypothetical protein
MKRQLWLLSALMLVMMSLVLGCAQSYQAYSDCRVDCKYCPPAPLRYSHYQGCECHSCVAQQYLTTVTPVNVAAANDDNESLPPQPPLPAQ